jgi:hypothetical protein
MSHTYQDGPLQGMTLRDHFAGQALVAMIDLAANDGRSDSPELFGNIAMISYQLADAMLAERERST